MSLVLNLNVLLASQLMGTWLFVPDLCRLESAFGSVEFRLHLLSIYERVAIACSTCDAPGYFEKQLEWMIVRKIKVSSLSLETTMPSVVAMKITALLFNSKLHIKRFSVLENNNILRTIVPCISTHCRGLKVLELFRCSENIRPLLLHIKSISELCLVDCAELVSNHFEGMECSSVTKLSIDGYAPRDLQATIWDMCPNLAVYSRRNGDVHVSPQVRPLQVVTLENCVVRTVEEFAGSLTSTSTLAVESCEHAAEWFARIVTASAMYTNISISYNHAICINNFQVLGIAPSSRCLQVLCLASCPGLLTLTLRYICTRCVALTSLDISGNERLREDACTIVLECLPNLSTLKANRLCISDDALCSIAESELEVLEIGHTCGYTDTGLMTLMDGCSSLRKLYINHNLVNSLVRKIWKEKMPDLQFLARPTCWHR